MNLYEKSRLVAQRDFEMTNAAIERHRLDIDRFERLAKKLHEKEFSIEATPIPHSTGVTLHLTLRRKSSGQIGDLLMTLANMGMEERSSKNGFVTGSRFIEIYGPDVPDFILYYFEQSAPIQANEHQSKAAA